MAARAFNTRWSVSGTFRTWIIFAMSVAYFPCAAHVDRNAVPSADPRNRLLAALRQCEIVLVECQLIPSEEEVVCPKKSISHPTNATVAIGLISLRTPLRRPRPSVKNAQFIWATPKLTSTSLFSSRERWSKFSVQEEILSGIPEGEADAVANDHAAIPSQGGGARHLRSIFVET